MFFDSEQPELSTERAIRLLSQGRMEETHGMLPWSSNYTFLVQMRDEDVEALAIYKPRRGERPLWDFSEGTLCNREVAAFLVSEALGWGIVPPTVMGEGSHGVGMVQFFIPHNPDENYFTFRDDKVEQLSRIALFDHLINNADRKGGHCLLAKDGVIHAIDHGICFHYQSKLRTVIWDYAGQRIAPKLLDDLKQLEANLSDFSEGLKPLLSPREVDTLCKRLEHLVRAETYPQPGSGRNYPWPPV